MFEKISTGIRGLDIMLHGGLIKNRTYLIKGGVGAGKTIMSMHFLVEGAKRGEKVCYVSLCEAEDEIKENMEVLGFDLSGVEIIDLSPANEKTSNIILDGLDFETFDFLIKNVISEMKSVDRIAIDPVSMLKVASKSEEYYKKNLLKLMKTLRELKATTILTAESTSTDVEDYLVNGVIELHTIEVKGKIVRGVRITKIRGSDFDETMRPYKITGRGIEVYSDVSAVEI